MSPAGRLRGASPPPAARRRLAAAVLPQWTGEVLRGAGGSLVLAHAVPLAAACARAIYPCLVCTALIVGGRQGGLLTWHTERPQGTGRQHSFDNAALSRPSEIASPPLVAQGALALYTGGGGLSRPFSAR